MEINSLYQVFFGASLKTREEVYSFISEICCQDDPLKKETIIQKLHERDKVGSTMIAEHVMLPHIESDQLTKSQILFIRLAHPILTWDEQTKDVRLLIVLLLKQNESAQIKAEITLFTRSLADEDFLDRLLQTNDKDNFIKQLSIY